MWALVESATVPMARGEFEEAAARATEALELVERRGAVGHLPVFHEALCRLGRTRGDYAAALAHGRRAVEAAGRSTIREWGAWAAATQAWTLLDLRAPEEARELLEPWAERAREAGVMAQQIRCLSLLSWAASQDGDGDAARDHREAAQQLLSEVNTRPGEAWLFGAHAYFALARVLLDEGYPDRAEGLVAPVLVAAERFQFLENVAYGALLAGLARHAQDDHAGADAHLERALEVAAGCGFAGAAWETHAALAALRGAQGQTESAARHSEAARQIVDRLAAGLGDDPLAGSFRRRALA